MSAGPITLPERREPVIDQMDLGMNLLHTAWLALMNAGWCDDNGVERACATLDHAISTLTAVREAVNKAHGEGRI